MEHQTFMRHKHPLFAIFYDFMSRHYDDQLFGEKRAFLLGKAQGKVLEIGVGSGNNFKYYPAKVEVTAIDPDPHMLKFAKKQLVQSPLQIKLLAAPAEDLPFPTDSFDTVVATLVFCTVEHPLKALNEVRRVLKPSGKFLFMEHVKSQRRLPAGIQTMLNPVWKPLAGGCHLNRPTLDLFNQIGFEPIELQRDDNKLSGLLPLVWGIARSPLHEAGGY